MKATVAPVAKADTAATVAPVAKADTGAKATKGDESKKKKWMATRQSKGGEKRPEPEQGAGCYTIIRHET